MQYWCSGGAKERAEEPHWSQRALEQLSWQSRSQKYNCLNYSGMEEKRSWGTSGHEFEELGSENRWGLDDRSINVEGQEACWGEAMKWEGLLLESPAVLGEWIVMVLPQWMGVGVELLAKCLFSKISLLISLSVSAVFKQEFTALAFVLSVLRGGGRLFMSSTFAVAQERWIALPVVGVPGAAQGQHHQTSQIKSSAATPMLQSPA